MGTWLTDVWNAKEEAERPNDHGQYMVLEEKRAKAGEADEWRAGKMYGRAKGGVCVEFTGCRTDQRQIDRWVHCSAHGAGIATLSPRGRETEGSAISLFKAQVHYAGSMQVRWKD